MVGFIFVTAVFALQKTPGPGAYEKNVSVTDAQDNYEDGSPIWSLLLKCISNLDLKSYPFRRESHRDCLLQLPMLFVHHSISVVSINVMSLPLNTN